MKEKSRRDGALLTVLCVFFGGAIGAGARAAFGLLARPQWTWPWVIFAINLSGAFLLGLLDSLVAAKAASHPIFKKYAAFIGTGMMGAFTTYGTFVDEARGLFLSSQPYAAVAYALSSLLAGVFLAGLGLFIGKKAFKEAKKEGGGK